MENGFSSPRHDAFPAGLRVLVVDDDPTWLKILEKMLKKCSYEVTTCGLAREALSLLRERKDGYDIVISDVNMPDMDGFKLLEHVGLEMDLPVIMMSVDGETSRVMKGVQHGACDYLLKPIRMKELRNIWQHVFRKKIHEIRDIEGHEGIEGIQITRSGSDQYDDGQFLRGEDLTSAKKRKDFDKHDDKDFSDASSMKKARVVWSVDLHQKFVRAVKQIGFDKVGPKKILDLMNVPWLTRENVASHLQKYRLYLSRLQKENGLKTSFIGMKHPDLPPKDPFPSFCLQNSINTQQNNIANNSFGFSGNNFLLQNLKGHESDFKSAVSDPISDLQIAATGNVPDSRKTRTFQVKPNQIFSSAESVVKFSGFDLDIQAESARIEAPEIQFRQENKPLKHLEKSNFSQLSLAGPPHHVSINQIEPIPSVSSGPHDLEKDVSSSIKNKPSYFNVNPIKSGIDFLPVQPKSHVVYHSFEPISANPTGTKNTDLNANCITDTESGLLPFTLWDDSLQLCWLQGDCYTKYLEQQNIDFPEYTDPGFVTEVPIHLYDALRSRYEYPDDPAEYSVIDEGLFIA